MSASEILTVAIGMFGFGFALGLLLYPKIMGDR